MGGDGWKWAETAMFALLHSITPLKQGGGLFLCCRHRAFVFGRLSSRLVLSSHFAARQFHVPIFRAASAPAVTLTRTAEMRTALPLQASGREEVGDVGRAKGRPEAPDGGARGEGIVEWHIRKAKAGQAGRALEPQERR